MEVGIKFLPCPLCTHPHFKDVHTLRTTLINVATSELICPVCNETVKGLDKLTIHLFSHMNEIEDRNISVEAKTREVCEICNFSFTDKTILDLHQKLLHQNSEKFCESSNIQNNFHCHLCSKKFKMKGSLIVHLRVAHHGFSNENKLDILEKNSDYSTKTDHSKQWECDVCSKMFTTKYFLKKHKRLHTGEMPYTCNQCNRSFTFQQSYHKHMLYHSSEKPHICNECGRAFKELSTLQNHARIHSGERPFACESCDKRFRQRVSYLVHRRIHTGVMPYNCEHCKKKFRYKVSLRSHKCFPESSPVQNSCLETQNEDNNQHNFPSLLSMKPDVPTSLNKKHQNNIFQITEEHRNIDNNILDVFNNSSPDLYSMLSPLLPEVESLCLSSGSFEENRPVQNYSQLYFNDTTSYRGS